MTTFIKTSYLKAHPLPPTWEPVNVCDNVDYDGLYAVSNEGVVCDLKTGRDLVPELIARHPSPVVTLTARDGQQRTYDLDRVVLVSFDGPPPYRGATIRHKDNDPLNCHRRNLAWNIPAPGIPSRLSAEAPRTVSTRSQRDDMMTGYINLLMRRRLTGGRVSVGAGR